MSTETLHTCPSCNTPNFTARGLKAHRCKAISAAPVGASNDQPSQALTTVATGPVSNDAIMGQQLDAGFEEAQGATRKIVIFGAMLSKAQHLVTTKHRGPKAKGEGFKAWLEQHAPRTAQSRSTAYRFMELAEGIMEEFNLGKKVDLALLLSSPAESLSKAQKNKRRAILDFLEGKSQRQLLLQLGGDEKKKTSKKKDEDLTPEEEFELVHDRIKADANRLMDDVDAFTSKKFFQLWNDAELDHAAGLIAAAAAAVDAWRKMPKGKRLATAVQDEIRTWKGTSK